MPLTGSWILQCDACARPPLELPAKQLPPGWREIAGRKLCPYHPLVPARAPEELVAAILEEHRERDEAEARAEQDRRLVQAERERRERERQEVEKRVAAERAEHRKKLDALAEEREARRAALKEQADGP